VKLRQKEFSNKTGQQHRDLSDHLRINI